MNRLTKEEKEIIFNLLRKGESLNSINKITKRSKSTLYYYYKKMFGKKFRDIEIDQNDDLFIGEFIGLFVGDGYIYFDSKSIRYSTRLFFNIKEKSYVNKIVDLFYKKFGKKPSINKTKNVLVVRYYSKRLFNFILDYVGWSISKNRRGANKKSRTVYLQIRDYSLNFKIGFLRGFIDSDGYISKEKIMFASASKKIMDQTKSFLNELGFQNFNYSFYDDKRSNRVGMYHININKSEREKFFSIVKPRRIL